MSLSNLEKYILNEHTQVYTDLVKMLQFAMYDSFPDSLISRPCVGVKKLNVKENRRDIYEWTIQIHGQHWAQETELRQTKTQS